ncbi:MAG: Archaeal Lon protease [Methanomassiliicoccales archaeon PtaU1.Bin124]|nr:MAG: Archaeal Lon protease [Methanomassiliicoccales archaeon PtaU1.Bin124]
MPGRKKKGSKMRELTLDECKNQCPDFIFDCKSSAELTPLERIIGQDRAVQAMQYGLRIKDSGFNVFIAGEPGTGRKTSVVDFIKELSKDRPVPPDYCYVNNFQDSSRPKCIALPAGTGKDLRKEMDQFAAGLIKALQTAFESDEYNKQREKIIKEIESERSNILLDANKMAQKAGFQLQPTPMGLSAIPMTEGRVLTAEELAGLPPVLQKEIDMKRLEVEGNVRTYLRPLRDLNHKAEDLFLKLNRETADLAMDPLLERARDKFKGIAAVIQYLKDVEEDVLNNLGALLLPPQPGQVPGPVLDPTRGYRVNLIVDNTEMKGAPAEVEMNPTHNHLFGFTEKEVRFGALYTDYTMIRAGSAHKANGGFLVIEAERLLADPFAYQALKQTIMSKKLAIEDPATRFDLIVTKSLRPEPIPFDCKIVLLGSPQIYDLLFRLDQEFRELFKVKGDFDTTMERTDENLRNYASFVCTLCTKEGLLHLEPPALAAVIDHSSRLAEDKFKLSTHFAAVADLIREANFYALEDKSQTIKKEHIMKQLEAKEYRSNMIKEKIGEMIQNGTILIDTDGAVAGQVNGLAVYQTGDYAFGRPSRITASVGIGRDGVVDIERQAQMSGPTHTKGVLILAGYLNRKYAQGRPLSLNARLVFEQSYSGVDGDSASSTELYGILSALSDLPIDQSLAVTGSVNQMGHVQAIGGVNQKVEGYFEVCKTRGLTGKQGCLIPESNVRHLMLKDEVLDAIKAGKFHIYPIADIDEGIEVLTGVPAGEQDKNGTYPEGTVHRKAQDRLNQMAEAIKEYRP